MYSKSSRNKNRHEESWQEAMEPGALLEDSWFFGNLLRTSAAKPRMLRSMSDPCTSSKCNRNEDLPPPADKSYDQTYASIKKFDMGSMSQIRETKTGNNSNNNGSADRKTSSSPKAGLHRAPSLPTTFHLQEQQEDEEEVEFSLGKLIRQASMKQASMKRSENLPPRQQLGPKAYAGNSNLTINNKMRRKVDGENVKLENGRPASKWDLIRELQGLKNTARKDRTPTMEGRGPPVPKMGCENGKKSREDMKAQIKFWARAVASNVHEEC